MDVRIREERETDKATLHEMYAAGGFQDLITWPGVDLRTWIAPGLGSLKDSYGFTILADDRIVGEIGIGGPSLCRSTYYVGFAVGREFWNRGICTEALRQLVRFAFDELGIHKLTSDNDSTNPASGRVLEKAGFTREGVFGEHGWRKAEGTYVDEIHWGLINPASANPKP